MRLRRVVDWWFRNRETGRITVAQWPNLSFSIFLGAWVVRALLTPSDPADRALRVVGTAALVWWALDELLRGVNPFRRALGGAVLGFTVAGWFAG